MWQLKVPKSHAAEQAPDPRPPYSEIRHRPAQGRVSALSFCRRGRLFRLALDTQRPDACDEDMAPEARIAAWDRHYATPGSASLRCRPRRAGSFRRRFSVGLRRSRECVPARSACRDTHREHRRRDITHPAVAAGNLPPLLIPHHADREREKRGLAQARIGMMGHGTCARYEYRTTLPSQFSSDVSEASASAPDSRRAPSASRERCTTLDTYPVTFFPSR